MDKQTIEKSLRKEAWKSIAGGAVLHLVLGTIYLWGGISIYISSYLIQYDEMASLENISNIFPFMVVIINASSFIGIKVNQRFQARGILVISSLVLLSAIMVVSFVQTYIGYILVYGVGFGVTSGIMYLVPLNTGFKYPIKKGYVSGVIIAGYGFGAFVFNLIAQHIVNPNNLRPSLQIGEHKYFTAEVADRVPFMFRCLFGCYLVLIAIGVLLIKEPDEHQMAKLKALEQPKESPAYQEVPRSGLQSGMGQGSAQQLIIASPSQVLPVVTEKVHSAGLEHNNLEQKLHPEPQIKPIRPTECPSLLTGMKTLPFALLVTIGLFVLFHGMFIVNQYKNYGLSKDTLDDDQFLTIVGAVGSIANGSMRTVWALSMEKFGFKTIFYIIVTMQLIIGATIPYVTFSQPLYGLYVALSLACMGGYFSCFPAYVTRIFGNKVGPQIYSFVFVSFGLSNLISFFLVTFKVSYEHCFVVSVVLSLLGGILMYFVQDQYYFQVPLPKDLQVELHEEDHHFRPAPPQHLNQSLR